MSEKVMTQEIMSKNDAKLLHYTLQHQNILNFL